MAGHSEINHITNYGKTNSGGLRLFKTQITCGICGSIMRVPAKGSELYSCRTHPEYTRSSETVIEERKILEWVRISLLEQNILGIMTHHINTESIENRGDFHKRVLSDVSSNPIFAVYVGYTARALLRLMNKNPDAYLKINTLNDNGKEVPYLRIINTKDKGAIITIIEESINMLKKGFVSDSLIYECILNDDDFLYSSIAEQNRRYGDKPINPKGYQRPLPKTY